MTAPTESDASSIDSSRTPAWEIPEILGVGFVVAAVSIGLFSLASGISSGLNGTDLEPVESVAQTVQRSTLWATPYFVLLLMGALAIAWWQIQGWSEVISGEASPNDSEELAIGFRHLLRAQSIVTWAIGVVCVTAAAAVALIIASLFVFGGSGPTNLVVSEDLLYVGEGLGALVLIAVSVYAGFRLRASVGEAFL
jgi:hypothetical protein